MLLILSNISQILLLPGLRLAKFDEKKTIFMWFILISSTFAFIDIALWKAGIEHLWLFHIWTPLELLFLSYTILSMLGTSKNEQVAIPVISIILYVVCALSGMQYQGIDINESNFSHGVLVILSGVALMEGQKGWKRWLLVGVFWYSVINLVNYPEYHRIANIFMNICFFITLVKK